MVQLVNENVPHLCPRELIHHRLRQNNLGFPQTKQKRTRNFIADEEFGTLSRADLQRQRFILKLQRPFVEGLHRASRAQQPAILPEARREQTHTTNKPHSKQQIERPRDEGIGAELEVSCEVSADAATEDTDAGEESTTVSSVATA